MSNASIANYLLDLVLAFDSGQVPLFAIHQAVRLYSPAFEGVPPGDMDRHTDLGLNLLKHEQMGCHVEADETVAYIKCILFKIRAMDGSGVNEESHQIWETLGSWWDENVEDGDYFHRAFVFPTLEKWLALKGREHVLDAGCGNGALARRMSWKGAEVLGVDFSSTLVAQARKRSPGIRFERMDLTDSAQLRTLVGMGPFDRVVCSMVLHDMPTVVPLFEVLPSLLKSGASFVFSIPHPCFNAPSVLFEPEGGLTVSKYIHTEMARMRSKPGQPIEQLVFHRPLQEYCKLLIHQGMVLMGLEEPCVDPEGLPEGSLWAQRPAIPPALLTWWVYPG